MTEKTITVYSKTTGCAQCNLTKRALTSEGVIDDVNIIYIDQPENADTLKMLISQGLTQAPVVMTNFPVELNGQQVTEWTGFIPSALKQAAQELKKD